MVARRGGDHKTLFSALALMVTALFLLPHVSYLFPLNNSVGRVTVDRSFVHSLKLFLGRPTDFPGQPRNSGHAVGRRLWAPPTPLNVYIHEMPSKFTYDLLSHFHSTYQQTTNLTSNGSPVHRLIEQHSVDYWLFADLVLPQSQRYLRSVIRVREQSEADVFFIPFFSTISFFLLDKPGYKRLYRDALKWILDQPAWQRSGGRDHVLPVHHPWSFKSVRHHLKNAIWLLPDLDSTGNWYRPGEVSLEKDVVLPYVSNVEACKPSCLASSWAQRRTLLFFRGRTKRNAGGKIRNKLVAILLQEKDVVVEEGSPDEEGKQAAQSGMRSSVFCLSPAGDTPSSARLFDAIVSGCIPVVVSDELELPFEGFLDYRKIALFVSSTQALQKGWLMAYLRGIGEEQLALIRNNLAQSSRHFQYSNPAQPLGPEDLTWRMISAKLPSLKLHVRRSERLVEGARNVCSCDCRNDNLTVYNPNSVQSQKQTYT